MTGRDISITDAGRLDHDLVAIGSDLSGDGYLTLKRYIHHDESGEFRIDLDDTRTVLQAKPAACDWTLLEHHSGESDLSWRVTGRNREYGS